jgi:hypothetical protein
MLCSLSSKITTEDLKNIQELEKDLNKTLLSFSCHDLKVADLTEDQLAKIKSLEEKLGVSLVAVND